MKTKIFALIVVLFATFTLSAQPVILPNYIKVIEGASIDSTLASKEVACIKINDGSYKISYEHTSENLQELVKDAINILTKNDKNFMRPDYSSYSDIQFFQLMASPENVDAIVSMNKNIKVYYSYYMSKGWYVKIYLTSEEYNILIFDETFKDITV